VFWCNFPPYKFVKKKKKVKKKKYAPSQSKTADSTFHIDKTYIHKSSFTTRVSMIHTSGVCAGKINCVSVFGGFTGTGTQVKSL